jgi:CheY-like chemotaxis protein
MKVHSILVVDDDSFTRRAMQQVLEPLGYAVTVAKDGQEAIRSVQREKVDLVITDLIMPGTDGFELIANLRENFTSVEVVAISGGGHLGADTYLTIARGLGVDVVLQKPITKENLVMAIKAVEGRSLRRARRGPKKS